MSEERRAVIEAALRESLFPKGTRVAILVERSIVMSRIVERALAEWERSREPTDAERHAGIRWLGDRTRSHGLLDEQPMGDLVAGVLRAARDVREDTDE